VDVVADPSGTDGESQYQASLHDRSTTNFWAVIFHMPHPTPLTTSSVTETSGTPNPDITSDSVAYSTGMYPTAGTTPASVTPLPTGGVNGSPSTGNNSDGTDTGGSSRNPTADQNQGHVHHENGAGGNTNDESVSHNHQMDHTHPHNASGGDHTHPEGAHDHNTADHRHNLNNHNHTLSAHTHDLAAHDHTVDVFPNETADRTLRVGWTAFGRQHADATNVPVSWVARG
jgi:hypothetical protein